MNNPDRRKQTVTALAVIVIIAVVVVATISALPQSSPVSSSTNSPETMSNDATPSASPAVPTTASTSTQAYKDGTYTVTGSYSSPGGTESISVTVTLRNDVITDSTAKGLATDSDGAEYQAKFISGYKSLVVGKSVETVSLSRVSGSSLTSTGFNNALKTIKSQAKS